MLTVDFVLDGQAFTVINGGPHFTFNEAISLPIDCADQAEVDYYWDEAHRRRRGRSVRMAEGSLRAVVAGRSRRAAGAPAGRGRGPRAARNGRDAEMGKIDVAALYAAADQT